MGGSLLSQQPICVLISDSQHMYATQGDLVHRKIIHALNQGLLEPQWVMCKHCKCVSPSTYHCCWHTKVTRGPQIYHKSGNHFQIPGTRRVTWSSWILRIHNTGLTCKPVIWCFLLSASELIYVCTSGKICKDYAENIRCHHKENIPHELGIYTLLKVTAVNTKLSKFWHVIPVLRGLEF